MRPREVWGHVANSKYARSRKTNSSYVQPEVLFTALNYLSKAPSTSSFSKTNPLPKPVLPKPASLKGLTCHSSAPEQNDCWLDCHFYAFSKITQENVQEIDTEQTPCRRLTFWSIIQWVPLFYNSPLPQPPTRPSTIKTRQRGWFPLRSWEGRPEKEPREKRVTKSWI